jgi:hypothetical protein
LKRVSLPILVAVATLGVAGCGVSRGPTSAGGHTYVQDLVTNQSLAPTPDIYVTLVSPVAIPANVLRRSGRLVAQAKGPQECSYTRPLAGFGGNATYLNGKVVTLKVNGSNRITAEMCSQIKNEQTLNIGGSSATRRSGSGAKYSIRAVESAFADHGITLKPDALVTDVMPGLVVLRDDHQVAVWVIVNRHRLGGMYGEKKKGSVIFRHRRKGNLVVSYGPARARAVTAALAELGP